jgi:hypothetical protein
MNNVDKAHLLMSLLLKLLHNAGRMLPATEREERLRERKDRK